MTNKTFTIHVGVRENLQVSGMIVSVKYESHGTPFDVWKAWGYREYYRYKTTEWHNTFKIYINPVRKSLYNLYGIVWE